MTHPQAAACNIAQRDFLQAYGRGRVSHLQVQRVHSRKPAPTARPLVRKRPLPPTDLAAQLQSSSMRLGSPWRSGLRHGLWCNRGPALARRSGHSLGSPGACRLQPQHNQARSSSGRPAADMSSSR